jgi:hypothetical protein
MRMPHALRAVFQPGSAADRTGQSCSSTAGFAIIRRRLAVRTVDCPINTTAGNRARSQTVGAFPEHTTLITAPAHRFDLCTEGEHQQAHRNEPTLKLLHIFHEIVPCNAPRLRLRLPPLCVDPHRQITLLRHIVQRRLLC